MPVSKEEQVAWVRAVAAYLGVSLTELARRARLAPSTLQRPLNDPQFDGMMSGRTLAAVGDVAGLRPFEYPTRPGGMAEAEAEPYRAGEAVNALEANLDRAVRELTQGRNGRDPWLIKGFALENAGVLPGDIAIVDLNRQPQPKDIVCAQIYQWSHMKAETVFRIYEPPFLLTASQRLGSSPPLTVDGQNIVVRGVVDYVLRRTRAPG